MNPNTRKRVVLLALAALLAAPFSAEAFIPTGGVANGRVNLAVWPLRQMDVNGDGQVSGDDEGVLIMIDDDFTDAEREQLVEGFNQWAQIPESYLAYRHRIVQGAIELDIGLAESDQLNYVALVIPDDGFVPAGLVYVSFTTYIVNSGIYDIRGEQVQLTGPQIIDADMAIAEYELFNDIPVPRITLVEEFPELSATTAVTLRSIGAVAGGFFGGLWQSPLSNLEGDVAFFYQVSPDEVSPILVENEPYPWRNAEGELVQVGVTPTMYPGFFSVETTNGQFRFGYQDLAPDDAAGAVHLYPREDQSNTFTMTQEVRTISRPDFPSRSVPGAHVVAWVDADNQPQTPRVPVYSTIASLYSTTPELAPEMGGFFTLPRMYRRLETLEGQAFQATYTVTSSWIPFPEEEWKSFDGTHGAVDGGTGGEGGEGYDFLEDYAWQTFVALDENIYQVLPDQGTPIKYDSARRQIVAVISEEDERPLTQVLPGTTPMFGDAHTVCPLNEVVGGLDSQRSLPMARNLRDSVLLHSAAGVALADAYYQAAPSVTGFLRAHEWAFAAARGAMSGVEWLLGNLWALALAPIGFVAAAAALRGWMRRRRLGALLVLLALGGMLYAGAAQAQQMPLPLDFLAKKADAVVMGTVVTVEMDKNEKDQIVTYISIEAEDVVKGSLNEGGLIHFSQFGGEYNGMITRAASYPTWEEGAEVFVFFTENKAVGLMPVGGDQGKHNVSTDPVSGEKYISGGKIATALKSAALSRGHLRQTKSIAVRTPLPVNEAKDAGETRVSVEELKDYVREMAREEADKAAAEQEEEDAAKESETD